ncbi:AcrR family transcriptional regulator [Nocardia transvalensis]|uniref:AcrR family transcriptional regulator n=1 Tax=Nocardia transvalensis TaxID=37333 RepID=A0A7W9UJL9_9NOCA|nr:TetR/AcrR family transcriptional regulator [Nocardia transvalensis]MBB5915422.1 AcrR family transcriptional regulator [Nocardia transvalensis]
MASPRRIGAPDAKNRTVLMDAAEQLMLEEGYAAVTSRSVARRAGLKYQLVYYYFRTMDDLLLAVLDRRAEKGLRRQAEALASPNPLRALWEFSTAPDAAKLTMEFVALANHRQAIRSALKDYSMRFREAEITALRTALRRYDFDVDALPPEVFAVLTAGLSRVLMLEQALGVTGGHAETFDFVERQLTRLEETKSEPA